MQKLQQYDLRLDAKPKKQGKKNKDELVAGDTIALGDDPGDLNQHYEPAKDDYLAEDDRLAGMGEDSSFNDKEGTEGMDDAFEHKANRKKSGKKRDKSERKERKKQKKAKKERRLRKGRDTGDLVEPDQ